MPKNALTYSDIKDIERILKEQREKANEAAKAEIDGLLVKLGELKIKS